MPDETIVAAEETPVETATPPQEETLEEKTEAVPEEVLTLELGKFIQKEGEEFIFKDPENPEGTVYKDKSLDGLLGKVAQGQREKDSFINRLESERTLDTEKHRGRKPPASEDDGAELEEFPDGQKILSEVAKANNFDPVMMTWGKKEWRDYEVENGAVETIEVKNLARKVQQEIEARLAEENAMAMNNIYLRDETSEVRTLITDLGIKPEEFAPKFDEVLERVYSDPKNFNKVGIRRTGVIVREAAKEAVKMAKAAMKASVEEEVNTEIATGKAKKVAVRTPGATGAPATDKKTATAKNLNEALERAKADFRKLK